MQVSCARDGARGSLSTLPALSSALGVVACRTVPDDLVWTEARHKRCLGLDERRALAGSVPRRFLWKLHWWIFDQTAAEKHLEGPCQSSLENSAARIKDSVLYSALLNAGP